MGACSTKKTILTDTIPQKMSPPILVEVYHDQTILKWTHVTGFTATGRSPIIKYKVQWDDYQYYTDTYYPSNLANLPWKDAGIQTYDGVSTEVTFIHEVLPNFISKRKIMYRVQAINEIGAGPYSDPTEVKTVNRHWSKAHSWPGKVAPVAG